MKNDFSRERLAAQQSQGAPVWNDKADTFLRDKYAHKDQATGEMTVDGTGMEFAKSVALGIARMNGGDTTVALGQAFEADNKIKAQVDALVAAKKIKPEDRAKTLNNMRRQELTNMFSPPVAPAPATPPAPPPKPPPAPAGSASWFSPTPAEAAKRRASISGFVGGIDVGGAFTGLYR